MFRIASAVNVVFAVAGAMSAAVLAAGCAGESAQGFEVELFDSGKFRLSEEYRDAVVVVNFWYPSCPPCREEMPEFQMASEELQGRPVVFLGMFVPRGLDTEYVARQFVTELGLTFDFATDREGLIAKAYGIEFYPTTVFIAPGGAVSETYVSAMDRQRIVETVRKIIDG